MICNLSAIREAYLAAPDEAVFLERARILEESRSKFQALPSGRRQGLIIQELCERISVVVNPFDVLLGRVREEVPTGRDEEFVQNSPELFVEAGLPGWLDSTEIYIPDWGKLLTLGLSGLRKEVADRRRDVQAALPDAEERRDLLESVELALDGISRLLTRYAQEARRVARRTTENPMATQLREVAECCEAVSRRAPSSFREALQLWVSYHAVLSCVVGGRNVTPGRMDQYLVQFYRKDLACGALARSDAVELLAAAMIMLSQLSGHETTGLVSKKRTPNRYSHYYITVGGVTPDGESAVNTLSLALLEARRLVQHREPTVSVRNFKGMDRALWAAAVEMMRDGLPVFAYNDHVVVPALVRYGVPERLARNYAHCGCLNCFIPGSDLPPLRQNYNVPLLVLLALNGGRDLRTREPIGAPTPPPEAMTAFDGFFQAFREQLRFALRRGTRELGSEAGRAYRNAYRSYPLPARCLFQGHLDGPRSYWERHPWHSDQYMVGVATAIDSLLAIRQAAFRERRLSLGELVRIVRDNFRDQEALRHYLRSRVPSFGSDAPEVLDMIARVGAVWAEEVELAGRENGVSVRPSFYSWLYNIEFGQQTLATPDGRLEGEPLSADQTPSQGKARAYTEVLRSLAHLPHNRTCSGGTSFRISPSHFKGRTGVATLSALIEGYFALGGLHLQFIVADTDQLREAVVHPERHQDLLVRVTGFSAQFVQLPPEVQQEIIKRAEYL